MTSRARYALTTVTLGTALGLLTALLIARGVITLRTEIPHAATWVGEVFVVVIGFEVYFYGLHRLLHTRPLYRHVHAVHHRFTEPSAWRGLAFHPLEALLIMSFVPVALWLSPLHVVSLAVVSVFLAGSILLAHSAFAPSPRGWPTTPALAWYVTPPVHAEHHRRGDCNYGATLSLCDRVFGTLRPGDAAAPSIAASRRATTVSVGTPSARSSGVRSAATRTTATDPRGTP